MIRFTCAACNHVLRAPDELAGKKGKCAHCGAANDIPEPLSVEVSRAPEPSPFRSTADLEEKPIEALIQSDATSILGTDQPAAIVAPRSGEFFEQVMPRLGDVVEDVPPSEALLPHPVDVARSGVNQAALEKATSRAQAPNPPVLPFDPPHSEESRRAIIGALIIGIVLGFCLGIFAARLIG